MFKLLLKKQLTELFRNYFIDRKTGKLRSKKQIAVFIAVFFFALAMFSASIYPLVQIMAAQLVPTGDGWLYFAFFGALSVGLGVFGSVFNTYNTLYTSKDNDFLLSMPVKPSVILDSRMASAYIMSLLFEAIIYVPMTVQYIAVSGFSAAAVIFTVLSMFIMAFLVLALTCLFGWFIALISSRVRNKSAITVAFYVILLGGYYYVMVRLNSVITNVVANTEKFGSLFSKYLYPLGAFGRGCTGDVLNFLIFSVIALGAFFIARTVMSRTFISLATANKGLKKRGYKQDDIKSKSASSALLYKESRKFFGTPLYLMNAGTGALFAVAASVAAIIKADAVRTLIDGQLGAYKNVLPAAAACAVCIFFAMNSSTASAVSLEGKSLWILQSMPVRAGDALMAKIRLEFIFNVIPAVIAVCSLAYVIKAGAVCALLMTALVAAFILLSAAKGLKLNLKKPNLTWTNEVVPIKQDMPVLFSMLFSFAVILVCLGVTFALSALPPAVPLVIITAGIAACAFITLRWIKTKGARIFEEL